MKRKSLKSNKAKVSFDTFYINLWSIFVTPEDRERYARWQNHRISHFSFSIHLFLGFSVASLGYVINLLLSTGKGNSILETVLIMWAFSAIFGCIATVIRLLDFRYTALKLRAPDKLNIFLAKHLGKVTWSMFWVQIILYILGSFVFMNSYVLSRSI